MRAILQVVNIGVQIITTIPEISSTDHNRTQTCNKRIISFEKTQMLIQNM